MFRLSVMRGIRIGDLRVQEWVIDPVYPWLPQNEPTKTYHLLRDVGGTDGASCDRIVFATAENNLRMGNPGVAD